ncbi:MAG TPA: cysteine rich repeat-containing protein, partial [Myxococcaceae bacterium]
MPPVIAVKTDSPCKDDVAAFCESVQPGGGRLYRCLWEHEGELSVSCRARMTEIRTTGGAECKDDVAKFCATVPHTKGMLAKCLEQHRNELNDA